MTLENPTIKDEQTVLANLQKNKRSPGYSLIVEKCRFCKMEHIHSGEEGHRSAHCFDRKTGKNIEIGGYTVRIDWNLPKNKKLQDEYKAYYSPHKANES